MSENGKSGLLTRLHTAQQAAGTVKKEGRNKEQNYDYVRAVDVVKITRTALHDAGLVAVMEYADIESHEVQSKSGTVGVFAQLAGSLRIADPETGEVLLVPGFGAGIDYPGDKAVYKAMTGASKYAHASALDLPFGEDPEEDGPAQQEERAASDGAPKISTKQLQFLVRLLKEGGVESSDVNTIHSWALESLSGGKNGSASKAIEGLKIDRDATVERLLKAALEWQKGQTDLPMDTEGL